MANNQNPTGPGGQRPQNQAPQLPDIQAFRQGLKALLEDQGDYNNLLKSSIRELKKMDNAYAQIEARIESLSKDSINVKEVNKELYKLRVKENLEIKKAADFEAKTSQGARDFLANTKRIVEAQAARLRAQGKTHDVEKAMMAMLEEKGDIEAIALYSAQKQAELAKRKTKEGEEALETEKMISKQMGISGNLMQKFAEKLGVGEEAYAAMTLESRRLVDANGKVGGFGSKLKVLQAGLKAGASAIKDSFSDPIARGAMVVGAYKAIEGGLTKIGNAAAGVGNVTEEFMTMSGDQVIGKITSGISSMVSKLPLVGGLLGGIVEGFGKLLELSLAEDDKITKIGRDLGISKDEAAALNDRFLNVSYASGKTLISQRALVESQKELSNELGVTNILSDEILSTNIELNKLGGLDAKTRASIAQSSIITGKSAKGITQSVLGQVGSLKLATGISLDYKKVLSEASGLGGALGLEFAKYPDKLTNALVKTKAMGLELSKLDSMADSFLDFESSISKEFEAQLLTGKEINLAKAREAFLNNDLATAASEITSQVGSASEFLDMNRIKQESIAAAMGMSRDEMAEMLKQQEMLSKLGAKDLKDAQAKVEALKAQGKSRDEIAKLVGEEAYRNITNASAQEKIAGFIEKIQSAVGTFLSKSPIVAIIDRAIEFLNEPDSITKIVQKIQGVFATIFDVVGSVAAAIMKVANIFGADIDQSMIQLAKGGGDSIRAMNLTGPTVSDNAAKGNVGSSNKGSADSGRMAPPPATQGNTTTLFLSSDIKAVAKNGQQAGPIESTRMLLPLAT